MIDTYNTIKEDLVSKFEEIFGIGGDIRCYFAPGRVNLIGEHTDYNGGYVFPCALTIGTYMVARQREDDKLRFYSLNFEKVGVVESSLYELIPGSEGNWTAYPKGMMWIFGKKGYPVVKGYDILLYGNIPNGSGLSSSASVELVTAVMLRDTLDILDLTNIDLALMGQESENQYNGVNCGIMDQFAIAMGCKDHGIYLNTGNLNYQYVPTRLKGMKIVLASSNKKRGLGDSKYNQRRAECETALKDINQNWQVEEGSSTLAKRAEESGNTTKKQIGALCDLTVEQFEKVKGSITDSVCLRRARHAVSENERTKKAVELLKKGEIEAFGQLMNQSHISLRDDYEVTGMELDTLVETSWECEGVIGSRMTGAGFGGCTISIVKDEYVDSFIEQVGSMYRKKVGYDADFYVVEIGDGPVRL